MLERSGHSEHRIARHRSEKSRHDLLRHWRSESFFGFVSRWQLIASSEREIIPNRIGAIRVDPFDSKHVLVGGVGLAEVSSNGKDFGGMFVSTNAGITWNRQTFVPSQNYWCHSIVFHPTTKG